MVNVFKSTFGIGAGQQSAFIAAGFIGMFVGAATLGGLSDRYGRRTMYLVNLGIYSLFTLLAGFGQSFEWILVCRIIAGLGLGAELPLSDAYLSEMLPAQLVQPLVQLLPPSRRQPHLRPVFSHHPNRLPLAPVPKGLHFVNPAVQNLPCHRATSRPIRADRYAASTTRSTAHPSSAGAKGLSGGMQPARTASTKASTIHI